MKPPDEPAVPASRDAAQRRADRVAAFRDELAALEREGALVLTPEQRAGLGRHHDVLLERLAGEYEVDRTERERSLSAGMRAATLLGAVTLAAAVYTFLYRFWGGMPAALQAGVVVLLPVLLVGGMELTARRERTLYVTSILGLLAATSFVAGLIVLAALSNVALPPEALLAWAAFCGALGLAYGLRLPVVAALLFALAYAATFGGAGGRCSWEAFGHRPETVLLAAALLTAAPGLARAKAPAGFGAAFRATGLGALFVALLILGRAGEASFLTAIPPERVEAAYQAAGLVLAAALAWAGARRARPEVSAVASVAFVVFLYLKLYDWWWTVLPRWVFFLLLGVVAVACLLVLRRLHALVRRRPS